MIKSLAIKNIEISKNDILKNVGSGVHLVDLHPIQNDPKRIVIRNNHITELQGGYGIHIENSSCFIENNLITKNS